MPERGAVPTRPAEFTIRVRWDDICSVLMIGTMIGLYFAIGLWSIFAGATYLLGGVSYACYQGENRG